VHPDCWDAPIYKDKMVHYYPFEPGGREQFDGHAWILSRRRVRSASRLLGRTNLCRSKWCNTIVSSLAGASSSMAMRGFFHAAGSVGCIPFVGMHQFNQIKMVHYRRFDP